MRLWLRHRPLLANAALLLLALALVVQPVLAAVGELHAVGHATHTVSTDGDGHASDEDDPAHASGAHALLHQAVPGGACDVLPTASPGPVVGCLTVEPPLTDPQARPTMLLTLPFRPPIA